MSAQPLPARDATGPLPLLAVDGPAVFCGYDGWPTPCPPLRVAGFYEVNGVWFARLQELDSGHTFAVEAYRVRTRKENP